MNLRKKKREVLGCSILLVLIVTLFVFSPSLNNDFTNWDEQVYITRNEDIKYLSWGSIAIIFTSLYNANYHPLTMLSYSLEYQFFKLSARAYHTTNLIFHLLNCTLVFWLLFILTDSPIVTFITGLLFAVHPLHVEPVAWIAGRKDLLFSFFFLASLIFYVYYLKKREDRYYYSCLFSFILSLLSKVTAISLPFILLLFDYYFGRKWDKKALIEKIPFILLTVIFSFVGYLGQSIFRTIINSPSLILFHKFLIANFSLVLYLKHTLMPVRLSCQYPFPAINQIYRPIFLLSSIFVAVLAAAVIISKRYTRKILFGSLLFLIILLPALQLIPFGNSISSDRHAYIALIGLFYLIVELTLWIYSRLRKYTKIPFLILLIAITGALAFLSWHRCKVWKDSLSLWSDVLDNYPNLPIAYYNRGLAYFDKNEFDKALLDYNRALRISPNFLEPYMKRAWIYVIKGQYDKAISDYSQVIRANPNFALAYVNRAVINSYIGENAKAWEDVKKAMDLGFKVDLGLIKELQDKLER